MRLNVLGYVEYVEGTQGQFEQIQCSNPYPKTCYAMVDPVRTKALGEVRKDRMLENQLFEAKSKADFEV